MNILFLTNLYPKDKNDTVTDVSFALHYFVREWVKRKDVQVKVLLFEEVGLRRFLQGAPKFTENEIDGVTVASSKIRCKIMFNRWFFSTAFIRRYLAESGFSPDIIVSHMPIANEVNMRLRAHYGVPYCCAIHESDLSAFRRGCRAVCDAENIVWRSFGIRQNGLHFLSPKTEFVALSGIDKALIKNNKSPFDPDQGVRFVTVARLLPLKNIDIVLSCLAALPENYRWSYTVIGSGEMESRLKTLVVELGIQDKVKFTGEVDRSECIAEMDKHDVFVMVSAPETFGLVYLEAMARGLIVIGASGCGIDGVVHHGENGFLCEPGNKQALSDVLIKIYKDDLSGISSAGTATVKTLIDTECADRYLDHIRQIHSAGVQAQHG